VYQKNIFPPKGENFSAPAIMNLVGQAGQRPWDRITVIFEALKGRNIIFVMHIYFALSGLQNTLILLHRALPCAELSCPFRAWN